jgi:hypothetical protein
MEIRILPPGLEMPDLLDEERHLKALHAQEYDRYSSDSLRLFCHRHARYGLPTIELVHWLEEQIGNRKAIEIGSGSGDLAHFLGIPATDNRMQEWPTIRSLYRLTGQPVIEYPEFVQNLDAVDAVAQYRPDVVVGSWITQWIDPNLPAPKTGGNVWGVKEDKILEAGCTYILIGNRKIHGDKNIMREPHQELKLPFLRSRATFPFLDRVWIWNG